MKQTVEHLWDLITGTGRAWVRYLPWLLGFALFAWAGQYGCLLASSALAERQPYLVILGLSVGLILQLSMIVLALRTVGGLLGWSSSDPVSLRRIIDVVLLPFLGIYVAFGYVGDYVSNLLFLIQGRTSFFELSAIMGELNPVSSRTRLVWVLVALVALYVAGQVLGAVRDKHPSVWLDLASTLVTAFGTFLGLLSVFRVYEQVKLWMYTRNIAQWRDNFVDWLTGIVHIDVPEYLSAAWSFFSGTLWPGFWDLLVQPLVWFALAMLVAGGRFVHVDDIVTRVAPPSSSKVVNFLRQDVQDRILGDLDVKVFPVLHALRRMWKATVAFLAAYILAFTACTWIGEGLQDMAWRLLGMRADSTIVIAIPLVDAISSVLVLSVKLALLVVAFSQAEKLASAQHAQRTSAGTTALIVAVCFVLAVAHTLTIPSDVTNRDGRVGEPVTVAGVQLTATDIRAGTTVSVRSSEDVTDQRFVVVHLAAVSDTVRTSVDSTIVGSGHTYHPYNRTGWLPVEPGFLTEQDLIFEVDVSDLSHPLYFVTRPSTTLTAQTEVARFPLDLDPAGSAGAEVAANTNTTQRVP